MKVAKSLLKVHTGMLQLKIPSITADNRVPWNTISDNPQYHTSSPTGQERPGGLRPL